MVYSKMFFLFFVQGFYAQDVVYNESLRLFIIYLTDSFLCC